MKSSDHAQRLSLAERPVTRLKGVGPAIANKLLKLNIVTVEDLLFHLPLRYQDRSKVTPIGSARFGLEVVLEGEVIASDIIQTKRRSLLCKIQDGSGTFNLRFFHFSAAQRNQLTAGNKIRCYGEVRRGAAGLEMFHPDYQIISDPPPPLDQNLTPVYPVTEGLSQNKIRGLVNQALEQLKNLRTVSDYLPEAISEEFTLPNLVDSLLSIHTPPANLASHLRHEQQEQALYRLCFEELITHHLSLLRVRQAIQAQETVALKPQSDLIQRFQNNLAFSLTNAQQRVCEEIWQDLAKPLPMLRLVQGDVGSGKTVVAAMAALTAIDNGFQCAIMAPTEILAEQHYINFTNWLKPLGIEVASISGRVKGKKRTEVLTHVAEGQAQVIVGTHAIFQDSVEFKNLALVIVDEQHRFGVHQRLALKEKGVASGQSPHQLIMTATPIPRTLAMSAYVDLDTSAIDELPPGRTPIQTVVVPDSKRDQVVQRVHNACKQKKQAYWVCTLIEESEALQCQAAEATQTQLKEALPELNIGLVHGRMKPAEKEAIMAEFKSGAIDLLVATTVIEVGVDVPNSTLMIIENPERLGLAQLHQLRGRVGRGDQQSFCVLLYSTPLSKQGKERLKVMRETTDGFKIAEKDLELRGPGEVLGTRQTGEMQFRIADLMRDEHLLEPAKKAAIKLLKQWPDRIPLLIQRWLGQSEKYGFV